MTYQKKVSEVHLMSDEKYIIFHLSKSKTEELNSWIDYLQRHVISFSLGCLDFKIQIKTETNYVFFKLKKKPPNCTCCPIFHKYIIQP